jgi:4-hydroxy-3-methylbut-2-enyl diphosphate reductase
MEVIVGKTAGFCFGVKRAIELSKATADTSKDAYCVGSIVHNKVVNDDLKSRGLNFVKSIEEVPVGSKVIIRAHGVTQDEMKLCESRNLDVVDTTCPNVKKIHEIVNKHSKEGYKVIIIGDDGHPEVIGISGWTSGDYVVIDDIDSLNNVNLDKVCVVSQTTMNYEKSKEISEFIKKNAKECVVFDTVCRASENRQNELRELAKDVECAIVIGDKSSANSNRLYEIAKETCKKSQFIENVCELDLNFLEQSCRILVMAGASTPQSLIQDVVSKLQQI